MRLLLDTHALLWMVADDPRLTKRARQAITEAEELHWTIASLWEIGIKLSLNRPDFRLGVGWERSIPEEMTRNAARRVDLAPTHCGEVSRLPWHHRDPFDRLIAAQARVEGLQLVSADPAFDAYGVGRVW
ncbi:MAG: type II toxin-antitoxin system VapC family toxin [Verrucomicrobiae bacterium]|nr:type II toxin-antitoxin system VapC family toxin [Verrucomicrobiae bacterium]